MEFVHDLPDEQAQPWKVEKQEPFVSIQQWDGTGEYMHWALIPIEDVPNFIEQMKAAAV